MRLLLILALMAMPRVAVARSNTATVAKKAISATVFWIDSLPGPDCDPTFTDSLRFTRCHALRETSVLPGAEWIRRLAKRLDSETSPWSEGPCGFSPRAIVGFQGNPSPSNLVVFADRCDSTRVGLLMIRAGEALEYSAMAPRPDNVLALLQETRAWAWSVPERDRTAVVGESGQGYVEPPKPLHQPKPEYPSLARKRGIEGSVLLQVLVGLDGSVKDIKVLRGIDELNQAAIEAVKKWKFRPATSKGQAIACWVAAPIWFHL